MEIKSLSKKDYGKIIDFAIRGMHLDWYIKNDTEALRKIFSVS